MSEMFGERLSGGYSRLEEKYYALLDFLDAKGVPVYRYNDFVEERGLPAFPVTVALLVLVIALLYGLLFVGNTISPSVTLSFQDQFGQTVSGVQVSVKDTAGNVLLQPKTIASGTAIELQGIPVGAELVVSAEKEGYESTEEEISNIKQDASLSIQLEKKIKPIDAELQLLDADTGDAIKGASVQLEWQSLTRTTVTDGEGKAAFTGIAEDIPVTLSIQADGYEQLNTTRNFLEGELATIELSADTAALVGIAKLIVTVEDEEGNAVNNPKITVIDKSSDTPVEERTIEGSEALFDISKGTSVRLIVQKEGFLRYDSLLTGESKTLRLDEEPWPVVLRKGGTKLVVSVYAGQTPLSDAAVQLFDLNSNLVESTVTGFSGSAEFSSLEPVEYFVTAYRSGYLPAREQVNVAETEQADVHLTVADITNSAYLGISVFDSHYAAANNALLTFFEMVDDRELPLGVPSMSTDITGYASIKPKIGSVVVVHATKDLASGSSEKLIEANKENQMVIELGTPVSVVELQIVDKEGQAVNGTAVIESVSGELLFDGNISDGRLYFDARGNKEINLEVMTEEGGTFSQQLNVEGKDTVKVTLGEAAEGLAPEINFLGVFNAADEKVEGIVPGKYYWLKFETNWPTGIEKGGIHVRLGSDDIAFVDSQEVGIVGFDATTSSYFFGKSFQPLPTPGNEAADKTNKGTPGQLNKFLELYFSKPANTVVVRVKVQARNSITADSVELHYRAWAEIAGNYYRQPADALLGEELFVSTKTALYAETISEEVMVSASDAVCEEGLCTSYFFVLPNGLFVERQLFKPMTEELYALEIDLSAAMAVSATIKLDTDKAGPKLYFTGYEVDNFFDQPQSEEMLPAQTDLGGQGYLEWQEGSEEEQLSSNPLGFSTGTDSARTSITISNLSVSQEQSRKVRVYFRPFAEGLAAIKSQVVAEDIVLNEQFQFNVERSRFLAVTVSPQDVGVGQDFTVTVTEMDTGDAVQNATLQLKDSSGKIAASIVGTGSTRHGLQGEYFFKNSFDPGSYKVVASAPGYKTTELLISISRDNLLSIKSPIEVNIKQAERFKSETVGIHNTAKQDVEALSYELEREADFPEEFTVSVELPAEIAAGNDAMATVSVSVGLDEESGESLHGEAELVVKGMVAGSYPTKTRAKLVINYNKKLDAACLRVDTEEVLIRLIGRQGSSATEEIELENDCDTPLSLNVKVEALQDDPNLTVTAQNLRIDNDATEKLKITASNSIERMYSMQERKRFTIELESPQLAKSIDIIVELWNPSFNLSYPPTITLWLARAAAEEAAYAQSPLQVRNIGTVPITAFRAAIDSTAYKRFGITAEIRPNIANGLSSSDYYSWGGYDDYRYSPYYSGIYDDYGYDPYYPSERYGDYGYDPYYDGMYGYSNYSSGITLAPGEALSPMHYVYAETDKTEALQSPAQGYIYFTGVIMGRQYPNLGRTVVAVNWTGMKCLEAEPVGSMLFSSRKADALLEREIRIRNKCGEPVRITGGTKPGKVGANQFTLFPGNITVQPGQEAVFSLRMIGAQEMDRTIKLRVVGLLVAQNRAIESNDLTVTLKLGELIAKTEGKATKKIAIKECETDELRELSFPVLSSDCSQGYCDARQLATYIIKKADSLIKVANDKATRAGHQAVNLGCGAAERVHCTFDEMGIGAEIFPVFVQLDFMDYETLLHELKEQSKTELKNYDVIPQAADLRDIGAVGFNFGNVYLGKEFKGCGKYVVEILGAVRVMNREIVTSEGRNFVIAVNIEQDRADTEECLHKVQNVVNFLPVDEGYTILASYHAWPGAVEGGEEEFGDLPVELAKELFKKAEGRHSAAVAASNSKLKLVKGDASQGLLKLKIGTTGKPDEPKTVFAHVPDTFTAENKELVKSIAKAMQTFKAASFGEDDCWGEDGTGQYIVMRSFKDIEKLFGDLLIKGDDAIRINNLQLQCVDFNVESKVDESVQISTDFLEYYPRTGIEYVEIYEKAEYERKGKEAKALLREENRAEEQESKNSLAVKLAEAGKKKKSGSKAEAGKKKKSGSKAEAGEEESDEGKRYMAEFVFCVKGSDEFALAPGVVRSIELIAHGDAYPNRITEPGHSIALQVCGIHPKELVNKIIEREKEMGKNTEEVYFAVPGWKGKPEPPDTLDWGKFRRLYALEEEIAERGPAAVGEPKSRLSSQEKKLFSHKRNSLIAYFAVCAPVAWATPWASWIFDCGVPATWAALDLFETGKEAKEFIVDLAKSVLGPVGAGIANIINGASRTLGQGDLFDLASEEEPEPYLTEEEAETQFGTLWKSAVVGTGTKSLVQGLSSIKKTVTLSSARALSGWWGEGAFKQYATEYVEKNLAGLPRTEANKLISEITKNSKKAAREMLFQKPGITQLTKLRSGVKGMPLQQVMRGAAAAGVAESRNSIYEVLDGVVDGTIFAAAATPEDIANLRSLRNAIKNSAESLFSTTRIADKITESLQKETLEGVTSGKELQNLVKNRIISTIESENSEITERLWNEFGNAQTFRNKLRESVNLQGAPDLPKMREMDEIYTGIMKKAQQIKGKGAPKLNINEALKIVDEADRLKFYQAVKNNTDDITRRALEHFGSTNSKQISKALEKEVREKMILKFGSNFADDGAKVVKRFAKAGFARKLGRSFASLGKGVLGGLVANAAGMAAYKLYWEGIGPTAFESETELMTSELLKIVDEDGKIVGEREVLQDIRILKHQPYKIVIKKNIEGKTSVTMTPLTPDDLKEMTDTIKKKPESNWSTDCTNYAEEKVKLLMGELKPFPTEEVKQEHAIAYNNNEAIIKYFADQYKDNVDEELIMAVLLEQPDKIKGCVIEADWWKKDLEEEERNNIIGCAAKRLNDTLEKKLPLSSFSDVKEKVKYVQKITEIRRDWMQFRVKEAS